jgi:predicted ArsR family transcriptional regulator
VRSRLREPAVESRTRDRVLRVVSERGPVTTAALVEELGLTETAVRRHVDRLLSEQLIEPSDIPVGRGRRGRPAKAWVLSDEGHRALTADYDDLAGHALRFLAETAGSGAVADFARRRVAVVADRYAAVVDAVGDDPQARTEALVAALNDDGYAATARPVDGPGLTGIQLCQGHCPVQHVAAEFPQFCDAETEAFSDLLGVHVQRLATLAHGDHVCTTFVPTTQTNQSTPASSPTTAKAAQ